ncbi:MAG: hypothetical protein IJQ82_01730 [Selenomonadaceae bacterium]|nr:hypothetical protein [Selenomonadaceae bacterium]
MFGLGSLFSGIANVLSVVVTKLVPAIIKIIGVQLEKFGRALENFFKELGLIEPQDNVEEIGDKALQAEQDDLHPIKIEDFDSHEKYLAAIKEYEVDAEKSALIPKDDKFHKALEILLGAAIARYGQPMSDFSQIVVSNPDFYSKAGRLNEFASLIRSDPKTFAELVNYMENKSMSTEKNDAAFDKLVEMEKKVNPDATDAEIWTAISDIKK